MTRRMRKEKSLFIHGKDEQIKDSKSISNSDHPQFKLLNENSYLEEKKFLVEFV
jgi:hypothetical protein